MKRFAVHSRIRNTFHNPGQRSGFVAWWRFGILALSTLVFCACHEQYPYFHQYQSVDADGWFTNDKAELQIPATPNDTTFQMAICLRHTQKYLYNDIFLHLTLRDDSTKEIIKTTDIRIPIYNEQGKPIGKGFPYIEPEPYPSIQEIHLTKGHTYTVLIQHDMKSSTIKGVTDVGIKLY